MAFISNSSHSTQGELFPLFDIGRTLRGLPLSVQSIGFADHNNYGNANA